MKYHTKGGNNAMSSEMIIKHKNSTQKKRTKRSASRVDMHIQQKTNTVSEHTYVGRHLNTCYKKCQGEKRVWSRRSVRIINDSSHEAQAIVCLDLSGLVCPSGVGISSRTEHSLFYTRAFIGSVLRI